MIDTYFSHVLRASIGNKREWYIDEFSIWNPLCKAHRSLGLNFKTKLACERAVLKLIKKEGGRLINKPAGKGKVKTKKKWREGRGNQ